MERIGAILGQHGLLAGQVLLTPYDFGMRTQYLHARETLRRLLDLGVVPVVNENDTVADDEIRYGDNDRLAALVSHLVGADLLVLLTDTAGLFTADPRLDADASLIEEIVEVDAALEALAGGAAPNGGAAAWPPSSPPAKIAAWSGVRAVIAAADAARRGRRRHRRAWRSGTALPGPHGAALEPQALDRVRPAPGRSGRRRRRRPPGALLGRAGRCCPAGVRGVEGALRRRRCGRDRRRRRRRRSRRAGQVPRGRAAAGRRPQTSELDDGLPHEVVHRDDLVVLPT